MKLFVFALGGAVLRGCEAFVSFLVLVLWKADVASAFVYGLEEPHNPRPRRRLGSGGPVCEALPILDRPWRMPTPTCAGQRISGIWVLDPLFLSSLQAARFNALSATSWF